MGRFLCFSVNYNCLISFWKLNTSEGGRGAEISVSIVKGQLQDVPYSSELTWGRSPEVKGAGELCGNFDLDWCRHTNRTPSKIQGAAAG